MVNKVLTIVLAAILLACAFFITDRMERDIIESKEQSIVTAESAAIYQSDSVFVVNLCRYHLQLI